MKKTLLFRICLNSLLWLTVFCFSIQESKSQAPSGYQLVWSDEFNGATIDANNWGFDIGGSGWGNNELQYYTDRADNAYLSSGNLVIEAKQESFGGRNYTSARLLTKNKRDFLFGRIDIRAKLPKGQGIWPALWSLGKNIDQVSWPACGEMDIMEMLGHEPNKMYSTVHYAPTSSTYNYITNNYTLPSGDFSDDFHIFSLEWQNNLIKFYVDNNLIATLTNTTITGNYPFNNPFFLIFNVAVGGNWPGSPDATTTFPQKMFVDYVRVYQQTTLLNAGPTVAAATPTEPASRVISLYSNAYTNTPVDTWSASWDAADVTDVQVAGNDNKKYTNLTFAGVEFHTPGPTVDATTMERFHADIWTPDAGTFKLKLVDFGANGIFGGGDDTEHELTFSPTLGNWYSIDVPLSSFSGMTSKAHIAQMILVGEGGGKTVWVDNVYFYKLPPTEPTTAAATPTPSASNVISLFSNAYTNVAVDTWSASWDQADLADVTIAGNATKKYSNLNFAGVEFHTPGPVVNATNMERFHADIWTSNATTFKVKLVDFGANGSYGGGDDTEHELTFTPTIGEWYAIDVSLNDFANMTSRAHIAQMIFVGGGDKTVWVDNVYFYRTVTPTEPTSAAPTPTQLAANVISLFSNAYTNVAVDTWSAVWDMADVTDVQVAGNATKKYTNLTYAGVEFHTPGPVVDATNMERFHLDVWSLDASTFNVKLVDFGANGVFGGGDDTEHELSFSPTLTGWYSIDVPLSSFTGMTSKAHIAQMVLVGAGGGKTVWVDNVYFYKSPATEPTAAAPTPTQLAANVISLFSNAYTNVAVDTWSASWDMADVTDVQVAGNATKKYTNLTFAGIEFHTPGPVVNATNMDRFHLDVWSLNASTFKVKLVDFGANGIFGGGDDTEHELSFSPTLTGWYSIDVPLSSFTGMTAKAHIAQLILVGVGGSKTVWVDNVYFYKSPAVEPTAAAPTPTQSAANVISLFSNAYTNVAVDTWSAVWDMADVTDVQVAGNTTKKYTNLTFAGAEFHTPGPAVNATNMERFHLDVWSLDASTFKVKLVDFGANGIFGGGDDTEHELSFSPTLNNWYSIDVPLSSFTGMTSKAHIAQLIFVGEGGGKTVWIDNIYFYKVCQANSTLNDNPIAAGTYLASDAISSQGKINSGANVTFSAGKSVVLSPGFLANSNSVFTAQIGGCTN